MKNLVAIIAGDPESINTEIIAKAWKKKIYFNKTKIFVIGNFKLIKKQSVVSPGLGTSDSFLSINEIDSSVEIFIFL